MEKNWERFAKVIGDRLMIDDGPLYPGSMLSGLTTVEVLLTPSVKVA
jgi:hypothetical protein